MISTKYAPQEIEAKWYKFWLDNKFFASKPNPDKEPYTIVIPPPNVTGVLHMGHMLNNTIQDVLIRKARMEGKEACWVPGTDHASIATEAKVVAMLKEKGIEKKDITREEFLKYAMEWKEKYGGIILDQLKKLGASCDWDRTRFTMEPSLYEAVIDTFVRLYNKGQIYRGVRMVNWDPMGKTALSDEEVLDKEVMAKLYYIRYQLSAFGYQQSANKLKVIEAFPQTSYLIPETSNLIPDTSNLIPDTSNLIPDTSNLIPDTSNLIPETSNLISQTFLTIATTRPETIMADVAICVNPNDERYFHLHGKTVLIPLLGREIPIILDEYVTMDFGTGCLKVTPAHDLNDYELGIKHKLPVIDILDDGGFLNEKALLYVGQDRFAARRNIVKDLEEAGHLVKMDEYKSILKTSERTGAVVEPKLSLQWFLKMDEISKPAYENVMNDNIKLYPPKFKNMYASWMENVHDWCISRQLWWGQQIPAFYLKDGTLIVAKNKREALRKAQHDLLMFALTEEDITQDPDVLDTWFSSWLWPISVFDGIKNPDNEDINYYYPTNDLVTAPEILFFWVARMIIAGYEWRGELPFKNVYLTGIVRDKQGRKMSKSLGNSPDPLDLIAQHGADAVRTGMLFSSPAGNDLMYDEKLIEQGRNFCNKIWNAYRLVEGWTVQKSPLTETSNRTNGGTKSPLTDSSDRPDGGTYSDNSSSLIIPNIVNLTERQAPPLGRFDASTGGAAISWFNSKMSQTIIEIQDHFSKFRISDALLSIYNLIWDDFCGKYLEMIKPAFEQPIDQFTYDATIEIFDKLMRLAHPYMPFITEEIWQEVSKRYEKETIVRAEYPIAGLVDEKILADFDILFSIVSKIRETRNTKQLSPKIALPLAIKTVEPARYQVIETIIIKLANIEKIEFVSEKQEKSLSFVIKSDEFFIALAEEENSEEVLAQAKKDLEYYQNFKKSVETKLSNERFVANAKHEIIEKEKQKLADAEAKIKALVAVIAELSN